MKACCISRSPEDLNADDEQLSVYALVFGKETILFASWRAKFVGVKIEPLALFLTHKVIWENGGVIFNRYLHLFWIYCRCWNSRMFSLLTSQNVVVQPACVMCRANSLTGISEILPWYYVSFLRLIIKMYHKVMNITHASGELLRD